MPHTAPRAATIAELANALAIESERLRAAWRHELGISAYEMLAISHLNQAGPMTIGELGSRLALSSGAMTGLVDRLERSDRLLRVRDEHDRRRVHLQVTTSTRTALERLAAPLEQRIDQLEASVGGRALLEQLAACYAAAREE